MVQALLGAGANPVLPCILHGQRTSALHLAILDKQETTLKVPCCPVLNSAERSTPGSLRTHLAVPNCPEALQYEYRRSVAEKNKLVRYSSTYYIAPSGLHTEASCIIQSAVYLSCV